MNQCTNKNLNRFSVAAHYVGLIIEYMTKQGVSKEEFLKQAEFPLSQLENPNSRVAYSDFVRACELAMKILNDPYLGLHLGENIRGGHLGTHGIALMSCSTVRELVMQSVRYSSLTMDIGYNEIEINKDQCIRYWHSNLPDDAPLTRFQDELTQATAVVLMRFFTNRDDIPPKWVWFRHARPESVEAYEKLFQCPIYFNKPQTAIGFDASLLDYPLPHANSHLKRVMDDLCAQLIKQLGDAVEPTWLSGARKAVLESFKTGAPEINDIAEALHFTGNELKEKLAERGFSFRSFVDDLRHSLALGYMRDPMLDIVDIAYLLGFSEQSAFQRAFKRWTGHSPGVYRSQIAREAN